MLEINPTFRDLIPPLSSEEYAQLEANCLQDGIMHPIITWRGQIIDGHNRYNIVQEHGIDFQTEAMEFESEADAVVWIIQHQMGRRNLNAYNRTVLALKMEDVLREKGKQRMSEGGEVGAQITNRGFSTLRNPEPKHNTEKELTKMASVSAGTLHKVKAIEAKATPEQKQALATGEESIHSVYKAVKAEEKRERFEQRREEFAKEATGQGLCTLHHGDCLEFIPTLENKSIDLLLTDPPYGMDFNSGWSNKKRIENDGKNDALRLLDKMLTTAKPKLKPDAHLYVFGRVELLQEFSEIVGNHFRIKNVLIWDRQVIGMGDLETYGRSYDIVIFAYNEEWKSLNGTRDRDILSFARVPPSKLEHPTEKPVDLLKYLIKKSTNEGGKILEPFAGGGSTIQASINLGRHCFASEIEKEYYELIKRRGFYKTRL